jgi:hypothetical protein
VRHSYGLKPAQLPSAIDGIWYHPGPSGLSRLWLYAAAEGGTGADAANALVRMYQGTRDERHRRGVAPLLAFRFDWGMAWANGTARACRLIELVHRLHAPAAAMQLSSAPPDALLWRECAALRDALPAGGGASWEALPRPKYWRHRGEWEPAF